MTFALALLLLVEADSTPPKPESLDVIYYGGKRVIYNAEQSLVYLLDSAWVRYQDMSLKSDSIVYDIKQHRLSSYHASTFRTGTDSVSGVELHYDVDTRKGYMTQAGTAVNQGFFSGHELWLVREKTLDVDHGTYTTCDHKTPHYHFWGGRIKAYLDDMVVVSPIVLKVGKVPVAWAPFWFFPIGKTRKSGLLPFKVGRSDAEGFYAKGLSYYWAINDYADATFVLDVMTRKGFRWSGEGIYLFGPYATGNVFGSYINESDTRHQRYSINAQHNGRFFLGSRITARADFQSDAGYVSDYSETPMLWLKNELESFVNITRSFRNIGSATLSALRHVDIQEHTSRQQFPNLGISLVSIPLFSGWTLTSGLSATNGRNAWDSAGVDTLVQASRSIAPSLTLSLPRSFLGGFGLPLSGGYSENEELRHGHLAARTRLAYGSTGFGFSQNLLGFLSLSENLGYSQSVRFHPESTHTDANYSLGTSGRFSLFRVYDLEAFGIHGMLHKVTPSASFTLVPNTRSSGFLGVPRTDTLPKSASLGLGLTNDFQIKTGEERKTRTLAALNFGSGYNFLTPGRQFNDVGANLDLYLLEAGPARFNLSGRTSYGVYSHRFSGLSLVSTFAYDYSPQDSVRRLLQSFSADLTHYLDLDSAGIRSNMLQGKFHFAVPGWAIGFTSGWNIEQGKITDYTLDLTRDLHCWELVANLSVLGKRVAYDFKLRIKSIPDVAVGKGLFGWLLPR